MPSFCPSYFSLEPGPLTSGLIRSVAWISGVEEVIEIVDGESREGEEWL